MNHTITAEQLLLLKAALFQPAEALQYWQNWQRQHQLDRSGPASQQLLTRLIGTIDRDSQRLMPLIYRNLQATSDPWVPYLHGLYRGSWLKNQKHLLKVQTLVTGLQAAGIDTVMLKGIPLSLRYYGDMGVRMTSDIDVLVPTSQADKALEVLQQPGFGLRATRYESQNRRVLHAMHLFDPNGVDVDLHWNLMFQHAYPGADAPFWADKQPITLPNGVIGYTLSPTHQVFHNLVHGYHWGDRPAIRWIPDTLVICRDKAAVDWNELLNLADRYRMRIPVGEGLQLLVNQFGLSLPDTIGQRLVSLAVSSYEQTYFDLLVKSSSNQFTKSIRFVRKQELAYQLFRRGKPGPSFPHYLAGHLHLRLGWAKRDLPF